MSLPYTYLIGWSQHDKWYYGVRFAKGCNPGDLWTTYFTSSEHVKRARMEHGEPDVVVVRKTFEDKRLAQKWECRVIVKMKAVASKRWLNKCAGGSKFYSSGLPLSEDHRRKVSESLKGRILSVDHREKLRQLVLGKPVTRKRVDGLMAAKARMTDETKLAMKEKMSLAKLGVKRKPFTEEHKRKIGEANSRKAAEKRLLRQAA